LLRSLAFSFRQLANAFGLASSTTPARAVTREKSVERERLAIGSLLAFERVGPLTAALLEALADR